MRDFNFSVQLISSHLMSSEGGRTELKMLIYKNMVTTRENKVSKLHLRFGLVQLTVAENTKHNGHEKLISVVTFSAVKKGTQMFVISKTCAVPLLCHGNSA